MMKRLLTILCIPAVLLLLGSTEGWSLPPCEGSNATTWTNCFGADSKADGSKYVGEWKGGLPHGQGTLTHPDGTVEKGTWVYGEFLG
jgi:hypothetical protein